MTLVSKFPYIPLNLFYLFIYFTASVTLKHLSRITLHSIAPVVRLSGQTPGNSVPLSRREELHDVYALTWSV